MDGLLTNPMFVVFMEKSYQLYRDPNRVFIINFFFYKQHFYK